MGAGKVVTKTSTRKVKNEAGELADKAVDTGPADRLEDRASDVKDKAVKTGIKKAF
jgi:hypothetical protein